jgi:predicted DNA-binding transcriptional regulator AlpA
MQVPMRTSKAKTDSETVDNRLLTKSEVLAVLGNIAPSTLWTWMAGPPKFPLPLELGAAGGRASTVMWLESEVRAWINSRPRRKIGKQRFPFYPRHEQPNASRRKKRIAAGVR